MSNFTNNQVGGKAMDYTGKVPCINPNGMTATELKAWAETAARKTGGIDGIVFSTNFSDRLNVTNYHVESLCDYLNSVVECLEDHESLGLENPPSGVEQDIRVVRLLLAQLNEFVRCIRESIELALAVSVTRHPESPAIALYEELLLRLKVAAPLQGDRPVMPTNADRIINLIQKQMTDDLHGAVRGRLGPTTESKYKEANAIYANEADKIKNTRLKTVLQKGDLIPEKAMEMFFSKTPSEMKMLYKSLDTQGKEHIRQEIISRALSQSTSDMDKISVNRFLSEMRKMRGQIGVAFSGKDSQEIGGIMRLLNMTRQAQDAALNPPTGARLIPLFGVVSGGLAGTLPTLAVAIGASGAAHGYESAAVRDALIRLAGTPEGSTGFEQALKRVIDVTGATTKGNVQSQ